MNQIQLYFDEDAMHSRLVAALRPRGVTVITVMDASLAAVSDEEQLAFATERGVLCTPSMSAISIEYTRDGSVRGVNTRNDSGAAAAVLGWRATPPHPASSRQCTHGEYAEPS